MRQDNIYTLKYAKRSSFPRQQQSECLGVGVKSKLHDQLLESTN